MNAWMRVEGEADEFKRARLDSGSPGPDEGPVLGSDQNATSRAPSGLEVSPW